MSRASVGVRRPRPTGILPLRLRRQAKRRTALRFEPAQERLRVIPGDVFHGPQRVTGEAARIRAHHRLPLRLRHRRPLQPEATRQCHGVRRVVEVFITPHHERPRRAVGELLLSETVPESLRRRERRARGLGHWRYRNEARCALYSAANVARSGSATQNAPLGGMSSNLESSGS